MRLSFALICIQSHRAEVSVQACVADVEMVRKMITNSGKSWGIYSKLQVPMEWMTVNFHVLTKIYPPAYRWKLQVISTVRRFVVSRSNDVLLFVCRDTSRWMMADFSCLIDIQRDFFDGDVVWWCLSQHIAVILHETHANYQVIMYDYCYYSNWRDGQNADFTLFELIKCTNLDLKDSACLHVLHMVQHPTSGPTTRSTHVTMVNTPKKNFLHFRRGNMANHQRSPHVDVMKRLKARAGWRQKGCECWEHCSAYDLKSRFWRRNDRKCTL